MHGEAVGVASKLAVLVDLSKSEVVILGAEYLSPKIVNLPIMVGLHKPQKVKGYLPSY